MTFLKTENLNWIRQALFVALFSFPVMPIKYINVFFIGFMVLTLFFFFKEKPKWQFSDFKFYGLFILPFIPYLVEFIMFHDDKIMQFELEKKSLFFVAPIIFYMSSLLQKKMELRHAVNCFISSVAILSIVSFLYLLFSGTVLSISSYQNGAFELRKSFEELSGQHPIYYGLFSTTASLWVLFFFNKYSKNLQWLLGISVFFMILLNLLIAAKMPLLILVIGLLWVAYKKITDRNKLALVYVLFFGIIFIAIMFIPSLNNRLGEVTDFFVNATANNTVLERFVVFNCSKMVFAQDFYLGIGSRNAQNLLDFCYVYFKFYKGYSIHLNSHNQYLTFGISYGIGIMSLFISILLVLFQRFRKNPLGIIFWFCSVAIMFTESILERQMGIYYFLFFGLLFLLPFQSKYTTNANTTKAK
jgi:O-antigen ligase